MRPILTDQDVCERMNWLAANGFPGTETVRRAKEFVKYSRGPVAEGAVRELAPRLPEESLSELVREYVVKRNLSTTMGHSTGLIREQSPVW